MSKYIIEFTKTGTICYTSHLDLMRIFKRAFKRSGIALGYSQGFNPHPKMGFAQPLSLGYWGMQEYIEFETADPWNPSDLMQRLATALPEGIDLKNCLNADELKKTLSAHTVSAEYMIEIPVGQGPAAEHAGPEDSGAPAPQPGDVGETTPRPGDAGEAAPQPGDAAVPFDPDADLTDPRSLWHSFMDQEEISVWKRQKKKKEPKLIDIRPMIREITFSPALSDKEAGQGSAGKSAPSSDYPIGTLFIDAVLDCGSDSNLSPELIITSAMKRFGIDTDRSEISVMRKRISFDRPLEDLLK